jgi:hypothetical protein
MYIRSRKVELLGHLPLVGILHNCKFVVKD